ncbi:DNA mismatch repair protein MutS [Epithele typhae]|uniref:DNA mismatch repair protein MutS n=1 Tax=Epithele typhae TaxID=378194 RepID=UPI0020072303|nr:DNA mismatch repair protein MutS [Epithele typhae]KAH9932680.1 DNA mismatch repair protein MutS [Epithele typhae]
MAGAYYDPINCTLYLLEDTPDNSHFDLTKALIEQVNPSMILTSSKADDNFMDVLRDHKRDPNLQKWNASVRLANFTSVESSPCLSCVGALIDHLFRARAVSEPDEDVVQGLEVQSIEPLLLLQSMQINADALFSLQIFEDENHASIHSDKTKEGLSLFGILNATKTSLGRALMRQWFLRPSLSPEVIGCRHDAVECFVRPDNIVTAEAMHGHLAGIKNVPKVLAALRSGKGKRSDWQGLVKFAFHALLLRDAVLELHRASNVQIVGQLLDALDTAKFREIGNAVNGTIDWEESSSADRICVRPHVDDELDNLKHIYNGIDSVLSKVAVKVSSTIPPDYTSTLNVVYFPQLGFLICVPMKEEWKTEAGIDVLEGWTFQVTPRPFVLYPVLTLASHVYFKSQEMHDLDVHIGDLHPAIVDREIEIIQALQEQILAHDKAMGHACDVCAELDCLISFSSATRAYEYRRPIIASDNIIDIKNGRHPLQELVVDTFVPNDAFLAGGSGIGATGEVFYQDDALDEEVQCPRRSVVICTGANACGKIALIQYMAQVTESATLGITDKIFTRVQTRESVSRVQSAFMIDLNQVSLALRNSTPRSMVLLDEFGKGTLPTDGAGLLCGVLKHFLERGDECPKIIATTHFHDIVHPGLLDPCKLPIGFVHMQVLLAGDTDMLETQRQETRTARVANGYSLHSHAITCAELFGVPKRVTARAKHVSELLDQHELGRLLDEEMTEEEHRGLAEAEEVCRQFLAWDGEAHVAGEGARTVREMLAEALGRKDGE